MYPPKIAQILNLLPHAARSEADATGSDANFRCGSFVRFHLSIDKSKMVLARASFSSNGCGYMLAASQVLAEAFSGKMLSELHGLDPTSLTDLTDEALGEFDPVRTACLAAPIQALRNAFADFRSRQIKEFRGEKALICTCFAVAEDEVEDAVKSKNLRTVDEVSVATNAGSGCGSCRMLIQEILDGMGETHNPRVLLAQPSEPHRG